MNPDTDPLRDALSEAWDKVESGTEAEPIAAEPASPEPVPTEETASEARARDEQGRFAKEAAEKKRNPLNQETVRQVLSPASQPHLFQPLNTGPATASSTGTSSRPRSKNR